MLITLYQCDRYDRKYLRFYWEDQLYQFTCLPNGLAEAPRKFTKILKVPYSNLRAQGHDSSVYLDDSALFGLTYERCAQNVECTVKLMDSLGFTVHPEKSCFIPGQSMAYLGFLLDSIRMTVSLTTDRIEKVKGACLLILGQAKVTLRQLAEVVGMLVALEPGAEHARVYYKRTEIYKMEMLKEKRGNFEAKVKVTEEVQEDLSWWVNCIDRVERKLNRPAPGVQITSDSSDFAWGGTRDGTATGGPWNENEQTWHINVKELMAVYLTLKTFCDNERDVHIRLGIDNMTSVVYINKQGGRKRDLNEIARRIWLWAMERNIWLTAVHLPGVLNVEADRASRTKYECESEWQLDPELFGVLNDKFGPFEIDLFASRVNAQCSLYFAWKADPGAFALDALAHEWSFNSMYAFPPFSLIGRLLAKVEREEADVCAVLPLWTTQPWFSRVLRLLVDVPWLLPTYSGILRLPQQTERVHPLYRKLRLTCFRLSGNPLKVRDFQQQLPLSSATPGEDRLSCNMGRTSRGGAPCRQRQIDCMQVSVQIILDFLTGLFESGLGYSGISSAKAAVMNFVALTSNLNLEKYNFVLNKFMRSIFALKPALPRYNVTGRI